jgi:small subunit ribosomal protein S16
LAVAIRLTRVGATKRPAYRVIAIDKRRSRDGRALEILGYYDPLTEPATVRLETDKIRAWIGKGAQPSDMVVRLMRQAEATAKGGADAPAPKRATRGASAKPSRKATAKAGAAASASSTEIAASASSTEAAPAETEAAAGTEAVAEAPAPADAPVEEAPEGAAQEADEA